MSKRRLVVREQDMEQMARALMLADRWGHFDSIDAAEIKRGLTLARRSLGIGKDDRQITTKTLELVQ